MRPKPTIHSFDVVQRATQDDWCKAKLEFFKLIASEFEPFLRRFQSDKPMVPFLHSFLLCLSHDCLQRFVTESALDKCSSKFSKMKKLDLGDESNLKQAVHTDIRFGAKRTIPQNPHPKKKLEFYSDCRKFLIGVTEKLFERSPLNYRAVIGASSLSPMTMLEKADSVCIKRFEILLDELLTKEQISVSDADSAKLEYSHFVKDVSIQRNLKKFDIDTHRLDSLFFNLMTSDSKYSKLWTVTRKVLVLFHGQAAVESVFSINKDMLVENLKENSLIAQRVVHNAIKFYGGVLKVPLSSKLLRSVKSASFRRKCVISKQREQVEAENTAKKRKNELDQQLKVIEREKHRLMEEKKELDERAQAIKRLKCDI